MLVLVSGEGGGGAVGKLHYGRFLGAREIKFSIVYDIAGTEFEPTSWLNWTAVSGKSSFTWYSKKTGLPSESVLHPCLVGDLEN